MNYNRFLLAIPVIALTALAQAPSAAVLSIGGDVSNPLSLTADDLANMLRRSVSVPDPDGSEIVYEGVLLRDLAESGRSS